MNGEQKNHTRHLNLTNFHKYRNKYINAMVGFTSKSLVSSTAEVNV